MPPPAHHSARSSATPTFMWGKVVVEVSQQCRRRHFRHNPCSFLSIQTFTVHWHESRGLVPPHPLNSPHLLLALLKDSYVTLRWRGVGLQVVCGLDLELSSGSDARRRSLLLLRSGKAWSDQLFLTQPARAEGRETGGGKRADGAPSVRGAGNRG